MKLKKLKNMTAVTLLELLLVILIIGIIIGFGIPRYDLIVNNARKQTARLCLELIRTGQNNYFTDNGTYWPPLPPAINDISIINQNLSLAITADVMTYECLDAGNSLVTDGFLCTATPPQPAQWVCTITANTGPTCL
ncbi:MAG: hypothetical protein NT079_02210 [Candidatus Omnitrophica bacterium]|nr:hypothetical protein [Candidatus Omnitrophota bacterium]